MLERPPARSLFHVQALIVLIGTRVAIERRRLCELHQDLFVLRVGQVGNAWSDGKSARGIAALPISV